MSTTAEKLIRLNQTKADIKAAIEEKGQTVGSIAFSQYANKVRAIKGISPVTPSSAPTTDVTGKLNRLTSTKADIKTAIEACGVPVGTIPFSQYPDKIRAICGSSMVEEFVDYTGELCNSAGVADAWDCDGEYKVQYEREEWRVYEELPDGTITNERTEYKAGEEVFRDKVDGYCGIPDTVEFSLSSTNKLLLLGMTINGKTLYGQVEYEDESGKSQSYSITSLSAIIPRQYIRRSTKMHITVRTVNDQMTIKCKLNGKQLTSATTTTTAAGTYYNIPITSNEIKNLQSIEIIIY